MNSVYIATSIDGFIADRNEGLDWLDHIKVSKETDMGYFSFMDRIDALLMGRRTFEKVASFDIDWPYTKPVYVLSNTLTHLPLKYKDKVQLVKGDLERVLDQIHVNDHLRLYIDGGKLIQSFLNMDLIDEMIITRMPVILGEGYPLFSSTAREMWFEHQTTSVFEKQIVQSHYLRKR